MSIDSKLPIWIVTFRDQHNVVKYRVAVEAATDIGDQQTIINAAKRQLHELEKQRALGGESDRKKLIYVQFLPIPVQWTPKVLLYLPGNTNNRH